MVKFVKTAAVVKRIQQQFDAYNASCFEHFQLIAKQAEHLFEELQYSAGPNEPGAFWTNRTFNAYKSFFAKAWQVPRARMGITIGNMMWYAELLENDYNGRYASFPTIMAFIQSEVYAVIGFKKSGIDDA